MGLRIEHLDTDVVRSRVEMVLHTPANRFHITPCAPGQTGARLVTDQPAVRRRFAPLG
jgi:hypothetical protein